MYWFNHLFISYELMNIYFIRWLITQYYFIDFIAQIVWALANVSSFSCLLCSFDITPLIHIDFCCFWFLSTLLFLSLQAAPSSSCILLPHPTTVHSCCCCCYVASVVSNSVRLHRQQPARLLCLWDSPCKNTGLGCHFLLQGVCICIHIYTHITESLYYTVVFKMTL